MISKSTHYAKQGEVQRNWVLVDADGAVLGRLATQIAMILRGSRYAAQDHPRPCPDDQA